MKSGWSMVLASGLAVLAGGAWADDAVKIGVLNDQSGIYADLAGKGSVISAQMAVDDFGGKVLGKPIQILSADHQNKPDVASGIVNHWIDEDKVGAVLDVPTSSVALAVQEITKTKHAIHLNTGAGTSDLTGKACSPTGVHWAYDTYVLARGAGTALVKQGLNTWFFITADYAFGHALENDTRAAVEAAGGKVVGSVNAPFPSTDFSSFLLQAQGSGAKVVGLANAGGDTINSVKQAHEFGLTKSGQSLAALLIFISDVNSLGLDIAQGLTFVDGWYWDQSDESRAWAKRWAEKMGGGREPTMDHAAVYSALTHYLKAIAKANSEDPDKIMGAMRDMPINDMFAKDGHLRIDGQMVHEMYLMQVKAPGDSKYPWDYEKLLAKIPGDEGYRPLDKGNCPLVK